MYYKLNIHKIEFIGKHWIYYSFWCVWLLVLSHADEIWHNNKLKNIKPKDAFCTEIKADKFKYLLVAEAYNRALQPSMTVLQDKTKHHVCTTAAKVVRRSPNHPASAQLAQIPFLPLSAGKQSWNQEVDYRLQAHWVTQRMWNMSISHSNSRTRRHMQVTKPVVASSCFH